VRNLKDVRRNTRTCTLAAVPVLIKGESGTTPQLLGDGGPEASAHPPWRILPMRIESSVMPPAFRSRALANHKTFPAEPEANQRGLEKPLASESMATTNPDRAPRSENRTMVEVPTRRRYWKMAKTRERC